MNRHQAIRTCLAGLLLLFGCVTAVAQDNARIVEWVEDAPVTDEASKAEPEAAADVADKTAEPASEAKPEAEVPSKPETSAEALEAEVERISPVVDPGTGTIKVTVEVTDYPSTTRPGDFVEVSIVTDAHTDSLLVPRIAVVTNWVTGVSPTRLTHEGVLQTGGRVAPKLGRLLLRAPSADALTKTIGDVYAAKLLNPEYQAWKSAPGLPRAGVEFAEDPTGAVVVGKVYPVGPAAEAGIVNRVFGIMTNETLIAVPLFVFMGVTLERSRVAESLLESMAALFGGAFLVLSVSAYYLIKERHLEMARRSFKIGKSA